MHRRDSLRAASPARACLSAAAGMQEPNWAVWQGATLPCEHLTLRMTPMVSHCHLSLIHARGCLQTQMEVNGVWQRRRPEPVAPGQRSRQRLGFPARLISRDKTWQENFHLFETFCSRFFVFAGCSSRGACSLSWHHLTCEPQALALHLSPRAPVVTQSSARPRKLPQGHRDFPTLISLQIEFLRSPGKASRSAYN